MNQIQHELYAFISRCSAFIITISIGVLGKISYELVMKRKMGLLQWIGIVGVSVFVGSLTYSWCQNSGFKNQLSVIVPIATLLGERILIYITANATAIFQKIISIIVKK